MADQEPTAQNLQDEWNAIATERETGVAAPEPKAPPPAQESNQVQTPPADPYDSLPVAAQEKLRRFDLLEQHNGQLAAQLKEFAGRVSALQSEFAKSRTVSPAGVAPNQTQIAAAAKDPEKWESLKKDFPEWSEGIEAFVDARFARHQAPAGLTPEQVEQMIAGRGGGLAEPNPRLQK